MFLSDKDCQSSLSLCRRHSLLLLVLFFSVAAPSSVSWCFVLCLNKVIANILPTTFSFTAVKHLQKKLLFRSPVTMCRIKAAMACAAVRCAGLMWVLFERTQIQTAVEEQKAETLHNSALFAQTVPLFYENSKTQKRKTESDPYFGIDPFDVESVFKTKMWYQKYRYFTPSLWLLCLWVVLWYWYCPNLI